MVNAFLEEMNVKIVPFGKGEAKEAVCSTISKWDLKENARDYTIGGIATALNAKLVTNNKKHFGWMRDVLTPDEVIRSQ